MWISYQDLLDAYAGVEPYLVPAVLILAAIFVVTLFSFLRNTAYLVRIFSLPIAITVFASATLSVPDQTLELYRLLHNNVTGVGFFVASVREPAQEIGAALLSLLMISVVIAFTARIIEIARRSEYASQPDNWRSVYAVMPIYLGATPLVSAAIGLWRAGNYDEAVLRSDVVEKVRAFGDKNYAADLKTLLTWAGDWSTNFGIASGVMLALAVLFIVVGRYIYKNHDIGTWIYELTQFRLALIVPAALILLIILLVWRHPVPFGSALGTFLVFAIFVSCLAIMTTLLFVWSRRLDFPIIPALIAAAVVFSVLDLNDNHHIRWIKTASSSGEASRSNSATSAPRQIPLDDAFLAWYENRPDKPAAGSDARYPVYILAAQGGGIYAATQSLMFLVKMQSACRKFTEHLFAISSVSGGSIGAAFYSALVDQYEFGDEACPTIEERTKPSKATWHVFDVARDLMLVDYLSPLVASLLFPDFAQRFLPVELPALSRARALEATLEKAWESKAGPFGAGKSGDGAAMDSVNPLKAGLLGSWSAKGNRPLIFFNTTEAGTGRRRLISPVTYLAPKTSDVRFMPLNANRDVRLSTAAVVSARFPWVTPAGWFREQAKGAGQPKYRLVDGGYFDNSGITTALEIIERLQAVAERKDLPVDFFLLATTSGDFTKRSFYGLGEAFEPVRSLLNSRTARRFNTIEWAKQRLGSTTVAVPANSQQVSKIEIRRFQSVELDNFLSPLPLGWRLAFPSVYQIDRRTGLMKNCDVTPSFTQGSQIAAFSTADCVKLLVYHQLRGDDLGQAYLDAKARLRKRQDESKEDLEATKGEKKSAQ